MKIESMNWMQVEARATRDDRAVLPIGSTEQHAYLSLATDNLLAERVAAEAAEPLGIPVFPVVAYGITPYFRAYPGTVSVRVETFVALIRDVLDGIAASGFRRILIVNGHGGNGPAESLAAEWMADHPGTQVRFHNWWNAPATLAKVKEIDPIASHASWMENFAWTRIAGVTVPGERKPMIDFGALRHLGPAEIRARLGEGNFGGYHQRADEDMAAVWKVAVEETRGLLTGAW